MKKKEPRVYLADEQRPPTALTCPQCGDVHDCASQIAEEGKEGQLKEGAFLICINCGTLNIVAPGFQLRATTDVERFAVLSNPTNGKQCEAVMDMIKARGPIRQRPISRPTHQRAGGH